MRTRSIHSALAVIGLTAVLASCKKGEGDPFLSVHSRKARVTGEWKMAKGQSENTYTSSGNTTVTTTTYDGSNMTQSVVVNSGTPVTSTATYTQNMTIDKDGTFSMTEVDDGVTTTVTGRWNFTSGVGKSSKNRERIILYYENINSGGNSTVFTGNVVPVVMEIYSLKSKEMVLQFNYSNTDANSTDTTTQEWTYTQ
ncbi:MAG: hypothetical protein AB1458_07400 [Bacteroidota bacterium]